MTQASRIAQELLDIKAVFLSPDKPFTWASGIISPIYCDNRLILGNCASRTLVEDALAELIAQHYPQAQAILGTATAGIPHAAYAAERLNLPGGYVRGSAKKHGRNKQIEGGIAPGAQVVIVEDLISTGGSVLECVQAVRDEGYVVLGVVSIFSYCMERATRAFEEAGLSYTSLVSLDELLDHACQTGRISQTDKEKLIAFRNNPADASWMEV